MGWEIEIANVGASPFFIDTIICHEAIQIYDFPEEIEAGMRGKLEFEISSEYMKNIHLGRREKWNRRRENTFER